MTSRWIAMAALGAVFSLPLAARAQTAPAPAPAPVVLVVQPGAVPGSPESVREAVSHELRAPVVAPDAHPATAPRGTLTIAVDPQHRLVVTYRDASGRQIFRSVTVPSDPVAVVGTIALLAGNLARDESGEILAQLEGGAGAPAPEVAPPQQEPVAPPPSEPVAPPAEPVAPPSEPVAAPPEPVATPPAPPSTPPPEPVHAEDPPQDAGPLGAHRHLHIGFESFFGTAPRVQSATGGTSFAVAFTNGLSLSLSLGSHLSLGVNHLMAGGSDAPLGVRLSFSAAPYLEGYTFLGRRLQLYGQGGIVVQHRTGGGPPDALGVVPYAGAGLRVWLARYVSLGVGARAYYVARGGFLAGTAYLPDEAILITGGLDAAVHF